MYMPIFILFVLGYFEGKPIPIEQPRLFTGGIMRPYQLEGTEWLKVCVTAKYTCTCMCNSLVYMYV